ncbi:4a-hydroxytetrahydrobiopterin dehydratase [Sulfodiicoccus acidiphilus]|uniref:Putative pterin-4-alpha-carbinolamine dehydratase n=1 Tax=Sulfodiicoccus acidiphilus TaxID=1670455 RepID=A0A348B707_9CREN|nr:4a-hydroxytetrahydrobiopterin dehydratase [Sulfodiicoccus acidiphilus]BBD73959.1 4a-hydroxytetrahydrobiopterin dehydratase [Sulfodiicoccus acidiphilus]GGU02779.1 4a-hydroxytetrahydrobiopterin dehydratase [Sulfodiicoccus acidiphilus]
MEKLSDQEVRARLSNLPGWALVNGKLRKEFTFSDFDGSVEFIRKVAPIADSMDHHPDVCVYYNKVIVELYTHDAGGLTDLDFRLAERLNSLGS